MQPDHPAHAQPTPSSVQSSSAARLPTVPPWLRRLLVLLTISTLVVTVSGILVVLVYWFDGPDLRHLWVQVTAVAIALLLCVAPPTLPELTRFSRLLLGSGGILLLLAVADSLNGVQDILPVASVLLLFWAGHFLYVIGEVLHRQRPLRGRHWLALTCAACATVIYGGVASSFVIRSAVTGPITRDSHPLFAAGLPLGWLLTWLGELPRAGHEVHGKGQVCATCGLTNIVERRTCKRCGHKLNRPVGSA